MKLVDILWVLMGEIELHDYDGLEDNHSLLGRYNLDLEFQGSYDQCIDEYGGWFVMDLYCEDNIIKINILEPKEEDEN